MPFGSGHPVGVEDEMTVHTNNAPLVEHLHSVTVPRLKRGVVSFVYHNSKVAKQARNNLENWRCSHVKSCVAED